MLSKRRLLPLGAKDVEREIRAVLERASWNQDVLDAVLRAVELPFASRYQRVCTSPIPSPPAPPPKKPLPVAKRKTLTDLQYAIIGTIHQVPDYSFTGSERRAAERMVRRGWLASGPGKTYLVTKHGEKTYKEDSNA